VVVFRTVSQHKVRYDTVLQTIDSYQDRTESVDVGGICLVPNLAIAVESTAYRKFGISKRPSGRLANHETYRHR
jgi:hypothetical protein